MSRKILQVGTDILTINDKLVSVKEDYPFWRVNANTSDQYWDALKNDDLADNPPISLMTTPFEVTTSNTFGTINGMINASNGSIYCVPGSATTITKITPNPDNVNAPIITNVGSFTNTTNKFRSVYEVGGKLIFMPSSFESIMILDLSNDAITFVGSLGTALNKFGKSCMADNGLIIAPAGVATQHLIFNPQTLQITLQTTVNNERVTAVNAGNGFIYIGSSASSGAARVIKINTDTLVETTVTTSISGDDQFTSGFAFDGKVYFYRPASSTFHVFNTKANDARITFSSGIFATVAFTNYPCIGSDGWVYYFNIFTVNQQPNFRINPLNNTIQISSNTTTGSQRLMSCVMGNDGNIYGVNLTNKINVYDFNTDKEIKPNRILSRYNIR